MFALFNRFDLRITKDDAHTGSHTGPCDDDIEYLLKKPYIRRQFAKIDQRAIRDELREYGAWDDNELNDVEQNQRRALWLGCGNIVDDLP